MVQHHKIIEKPLVDDIALSLGMSPQRHLYLYHDSDETLNRQVAEQIQSSFSQNYAVGLLRLGVQNFDVALPPRLFFWQQLARLFVAEICKLANVDTTLDVALSNMCIPYGEFDALLEQTPFMRGAEYVNVETMEMIWHDLTQALKQELSHFNNSLADYLMTYHATWNQVGRIYFHLAENKADQSRPFAFLATYTTRLSNTSHVQHLPLGRALQEYGRDQKHAHLLSLLLPVQKAAEKSSLIKDLLSHGAIFQPMAWEAAKLINF